MTWGWCTISIQDSQEVKKYDKKGVVIRKFCAVSICHESSAINPNNFFIIRLFLFYLESDTTTEVGYLSKYFLEIYHQPKPYNQNKFTP